MVFSSASVIRDKVREQCGVVRSYWGIHIRPPGYNAFSKEGKIPEVQDLLTRINNIIPAKALGFLIIVSTISVIKFLKLF